MFNRKYNFYFDLGDVSCDPIKMPEGQGYKNWKETVKHNKG